MPLNGLFGYHLQCFMGIYFHYIGLKYILKSTCYSWNTYTSVMSYQLNYVTFFNSGNSSYHFKLMGCSSLPWPHRYRHKSKNEPVTKVTTIHFTAERSSPPVVKAGLRNLTVVTASDTLKLQWLGWVNPHLYCSEPSQPLTPLAQAWKHETFSCTLGRPLRPSRPAFVLCLTVHLCWKLMLPLPYTLNGMRKDWDLFLWLTDYFSTFFEALNKSMALVLPFLELSRQANHHVQELCSPKFCTKTLGIEANPE